MKPRTLILLALVVAALGGFIALYERELPGTEERERLGKRVFPVEADDLIELEIEWNGATVRLERAPAGESAADAAPAPREWRLLAPTTARADRQLADEVARALATLEIVRRLDSASRADVGLEPPRGRLTWRSATEQGSLEIGGEIPASSNLVVASSARAELLVTGRAVVAAIDRAPGDWRAKEVLGTSREAIERIRLVAAGGEELVLTRKGGEFVVERPFADAADPDRLEPLLSDLTALRAERFLDAPLSAAAELGLSAGVGRLELSLRGETETRVIEIGAEVDADGPRYARAGSQVFETRTHLDEALTRPADEWRSRQWASFDSWKVERVRVESAESPAATLDLVRQAGEWRRGGDEIAYTAVGDLLYALNSARAEAVLSGAEAAVVQTGSPLLTVVLGDGEGGEETLTLHGEHGSGVAARVSGRDVVLLLAHDKVEEIRSRIEAVRVAPPGAGDDPGAEAPAADDATGEGLDEGSAEDAHG